MYSLYLQIVTCGFSTLYISLQFFKYLNIYFCKTGEVTQSRCTHNLLDSSTARVDQVSAWFRLQVSQSAALQKQKQPNCGRETLSAAKERGVSKPSVCLLVELIVYISGSNSSVERVFKFAINEDVVRPTQQV